MKSIKQGDKIIKIKASKDCYSASQISSTLTVSEMISILERYPSNTPIIINNGWTLGEIEEDYIKYTIAD